MKVYKGYELIKEIAEGNIEDQTTFNLICRDGKQEYFYLKEGESLFRDITDAFGKINGNIINIMSDFSLKEIAEADFELIENQTIDIDSIEELVGEVILHFDIGKIDEVNYKNNLRNIAESIESLKCKQNQLIRALKHLNKEIQSIKEE